MYADRPCLVRRSDHVHINQRQRSVGHAGWRARGPARVVPSASRRASRTRRAPQSKFPEHGLRLAASMDEGSISYGSASRVRPTPPAAPPPPPAPPVSNWIVTRWGRQSKLARSLIFLRRNRPSGFSDRGFSAIERPVRCARGAPHPNRRRAHGGSASWRNVSYRTFHQLDLGLELTAHRPGSTRRSMSATSKLVARGRTISTRPIDAAIRTTPRVRIWDG